MRAQLSTRLGLYVPSEVADDIGATVTHWSFQEAVWAGIAPTGLSERLQDGRRVAVQSFRVTLRYRADFPRQCRLTWRDRILRVLAVSDPDAKGERLHLICEAEA